MEELYIIILLVLKQFKMIFPYWAVGIIIGSFISVFVSFRLTEGVLKLKTGKALVLSTGIAAILGVASPICMYGTIPFISSLGKKGLSQHLIAAFMVSSILLNPNLFILSFALGTKMAVLRLLTSIAAGVTAGILVRIFFRRKKVFIYERIETGKKYINDKNRLNAFLGDLNRGVTKTAPYFFAGILLTALFDRYVSQNFIDGIFGNDRGLGVLYAASLGVPVYLCGGGTIPLLKSLLEKGMGCGAALSFMITGPATKITNLSAVKIILGTWNFVLYILFNLIFAIATGFLANILNINLS